MAAVEIIATKCKRLYIFECFQFISHVSRCVIFFGVREVVMVNFECDLLGDMTLPRLLVVCFDCKAAKLERESTSGDIALPVCR